MTIAGTAFSRPVSPYPPTLRGLDLLSSGGGVFETPCFIVLTLHPLNLGGESSKFRGRSVRSPLFYSVSEAWAYRAFSTGRLADWQLGVRQCGGFVVQPWACHSLCDHVAAHARLSLCDTREREPQWPLLEQHCLLRSSKIPKSTQVLNVGA